MVLRLTVRAARHPAVSLNCWLRLIGADRPQLASFRDRLGEAAGATCSRQRLGGLLKSYDRESA
jgi:hypothetical protein